jgi:hypothetical protein
MKSVLPSGEYHRVVYNSNNIVGYIIRRQCYIAVPPSNVFYRKNDDDINSMDFPPVHGGVTWTSSYEDIMKQHKIMNFPELKSDHWIIGWDYNHFGNMEQMMTGLSYGVEPTLELLTKECISVCNKLSN